MAVKNGLTSTQRKPRPSVAALTVPVGTQNWGRAGSMIGGDASKHHDGLSRTSLVLLPLS